MNYQKNLLNCANCSLLDNSMISLDCRHIICKKCAKHQLGTIENRVRVDKTIKCNNCMNTTIKHKKDFECLLSSKGMEASPKENASIIERIAGLSKRLNSPDQNSLKEKKVKPKDKDSNKENPNTKRIKELHAFNTFQQCKDSIISFSNISSKENIGKTLSLLTNNNNSIEMQLKNKKTNNNTEVSDFGGFDTNDQIKQRNKTSKIYNNRFKDTRNQSKVNKLKNNQDRTINQSLFKKAYDSTNNKTHSVNTEASRRNKLAEFMKTRGTKQSHKEHVLQPIEENASMKGEIKSNMTVNSISMGKGDISEIYGMGDKTNDNVIHNKSSFRSNFHDYSHVDINKIIRPLEQAVNDASDMEFKDKQRIISAKNETNRFFEKVIRLFTQKQAEYNQLYNELITANAGYYTRKYKDDAYFLKEYLYMNTDIENRDININSSKELQKQLNTLEKLRIEAEYNNSKSYSELKEKIQVFDNVNTKFKLFYHDCESIFDYKLVDNTKIEQRLEKGAALADMKLEQDELLVLKSIRKSHRSHKGKTPKEKHLRLSLDLKKERLNETLRSFYLEAESTTHKKQQSRFDSELKKLRLMLQ